MGFKGFYLVLSSPGRDQVCTGMTVWLVDIKIEMSLTEIRTDFGNKRLIRRRDRSLLSLHCTVKTS